MKNLKRSVVNGLCAVLCLMSLPAVAWAGESAPTVTGARVGGKQSVEDVIPLTMGNMRGHKMLYDEGWHVVTSSRKALEFAKEHSIRSSREALNEAASSAASRGSDYSTNVASDVQGAVAGGKRVMSAGTELSKNIASATHRAGKAELAYTSELFHRAGEYFILGNLSVAKRTAEDRKELSSLPGNYYRDLKHDFSNIWELTSSATEKFSVKIDAGWDNAFEKAAYEFQKEYDRSGESPNTLVALGPILSGYLKSLYHGVVKPSAKTIVKTGVSTVTYVGSYGVFLPVAGTSVVAGRTVQSVGLTLYYTGKTGVNIVAPTIEGGLLAGMAVLTFTAVPVTYTAGGTLAAVNQVAFTVAGPVAGAGMGAATTAVDTTAYVGLVTYDATKGVTKVVINQAASGVVLGYNALTAIPTHLLLGVGDVVVLAWEGPRLAIVALKGQLKTGGDSPDKASLGDLPVGTVIDVKKLEQTTGVKVEVLSTDPAVIRGVLERLPDDLRTEGGDRAKP